MTQPTFHPRTCVDCQTAWTPPRFGPFKRCPDCRPAYKREYRRQYRRQVYVSVASDSRPCRTCGAPVPRSGKVYAWYCSDECRPVCQAGECGRAYKYKTAIGLLCPQHYTEWKRDGSPTKPRVSQRPGRGRVAAAPGRCRQCGKAMTSPRKDSGWICSARCHGRYRLRIDEDETWPCVLCSEPIVRRHNRRDAKFCLRCRKSIRPSMTAAQVAARDGTGCKLCGQPVDMSLSGRAYMGPTVDHRAPKSLGGSNEPGNLQLAHRVCNCRKLNKTRTK